MAKSEKTEKPAATKTPSKAPPSKAKAKAKAAATRAPIKAKKIEKATRPSPLALVKDKFGGKQGLVDAVAKLASADLWLARTSRERAAEGDDKNASAGLKLVSNAKLLRLHTILTEVKEKFGTREKLISQILDLEKRTKDEGYKSRLSAYPVPRLWDHYKAAAKRSKAS